MRVVRVLGELARARSDPATPVAFARDGRLLAGQERELRVIDPSTGETRVTFSGHRQRVLCAAISPEGELVVSGSADGTVRVWDATGRELRALDGNRLGTASVAVARPDLAIAGHFFEKEPRLFDPSTGRELGLLAGHQSSIAQVAFSPDGTLAASASWDNSVRIFDVKRRRCLRALTGHSLRVLAVAFSSDGERVLSGSADGTVRLWNLRGGLLGWLRGARVLQGHERPPTGVAFARDGRTAFSSAGDGKLIAFDIESGRAGELSLRADDDHGIAVAASPVADLVAVGSARSRVHLVELAKSELGP